MGLRKPFPAEVLAEALKLVQDRRPSSKCARKFLLENHRLQGVKFIGTLRGFRGVGDYTSLNRPFWVLSMGIKAPYSPTPSPPKGPYEKCKPRGKGLGFGIPETPKRPPGTLNCSPRNHCRGPAAVYWGHLTQRVHIHYYYGIRP